MTDNTVSGPVDMVHQVFEFNELIIGGEPLFNTLTKEQFDWTLRAYAGEISELVTAFDKQDLVDMVDANLDLIYFALGTLKKMGLSREQVRRCMTAVHTANMTKKRGKVAERGDHADDAVKPPEFVPPEEAIARILFEE